MAFDWQPGDVFYSSHCPRVSIISPYLFNVTCHTSLSYISLITVISTFVIYFVCILRACNVCLNNNGKI